MGKGTCPREVMKSRDLHDWSYYGFVAIELGLLIGPLLGVWLLDRRVGLSIQTVKDALVVFSGVWAVQMIGLYLLDLRLGTLPRLPTLRRSHVVQGIVVYALFVLIVMAAGLPWRTP